jgi:hypothetical protein
MPLWKWMVCPKTVLWQPLWSAFHPFRAVLKGLGDHLPRHSVTTVPIEGWASVKNGKLLALIGQAGFSAFISADKNLETQQSLHGRPFAILLLSTNHWPSIRPNVGQNS